jgi:SAM-dependent methyltransferase
LTHAGGAGTIPVRSGEVPLGPTPPRADLAPADAGIAPLLCCPECGGDVVGDGELLCAGCGARYPVINGIPFLLPVESGGESAASAEYRGRYRDDEPARDYNAAYERWPTKRWSTAREGVLLGRLLERAGQATELLDLPCGGGRLSRFLDRHAALLIEADTARGQLEYARRHRAYSRPPAWLGASALRIPLKTGAVDGAVCCRLSHHLPTVAERERLLGELLRVSRRFVIVTFFDYHSLKNLLRRARRPFNRKPPKAAMRVAEVAAIARAHGARLAACPSLFVLSSGHRYALLEKTTDALA